jgi:hypothetical protein
VTRIDELRGCRLVMRSFGLPARWSLRYSVQTLLARNTVGSFSSSLVLKSLEVARDESTPSRFARIVIRLLGLAVREVLMLRIARGFSWRAARERINTGRRGRPRKHPTPDGDQATIRDRDAAAPWTRNGEDDPGRNGRRGGSRLRWFVAASWIIELVWIARRVSFGDSGPMMRPQRRKGVDRVFASGGGASRRIASTCHRGSNRERAVSGRECRDERKR